MSLDAVGIITDNIDRSIQFYKTVGVDVEKIGEGHYEGSTPSGVRIMLDTVELVKQINPDWAGSVGSAIVLCFKQGSPGDVDKLYSDLTGAGFESVKGPWDAFWGQRYASVLDPDGNQVDLFAPL